MALAATVATGYVVIHYTRILGLWGAPLLTPWDLVVGSILVAVVLEAARRESRALFVLSVASVAYILFGHHLPGPLAHAPISFRRFIFLAAYTGEGVFGLGLSVAAGYLFMFLLFSSALLRTRASDVVIDLFNSLVGHKVGGPAKTSMLASAGLGTMVGSSIANVVTTGSLTIPMMKRTGFPAHVAAAVEVVNSEGSQILPPVMGAAAFLMAEFTGIPYSTIALSAVIPAILYYVSTYVVIHAEAERRGLTGLPRHELPDAREVLRRGWHLLLAPGVLFYLLMVRGVTAAYAGLVSAGAALAGALCRKATRPNWRDVVAIFDDGVRQAARATALIISIGLIQQAVVTTGLGARLTELILSASGRSLVGTLLVALVVDTLLGMGMPTPIAYVLTASFVAPALEAVGVPRLAAHLFLFYFAVKSGSTPPVAVVAAVAASMARADFWKTALTSFWYAVPGFVVAFMFVYSPPLLMQGTPLEITLAACSAAVGVVAAAGALTGWFWGWAAWWERAALGVGSVMLIKAGTATDLAGLALVAVPGLRRILGRQRQPQRATLSRVRPATERAGAEVIHHPPGQHGGR